MTASPLEMQAVLVHDLVTVNGPRTVAHWATCCSFCPPRSIVPSWKSNVPAPVRLACRRSNEPPPNCSRPVEAALNRPALAPDPPSRPRVCLAATDTVPSLRNGTPKLNRAAPVGSLTTPEMVPLNCA